MSDIEIFDNNADQMFESELGSIDKVQQNLQDRTRLKIAIKDLKSKQEIKEFNEKLKERSTKMLPKITTERIKVTSHTENPPTNLSKKELDLRRKKLELIRLLNVKRGLPDFEKGDDPTIITRRFDSISNMKMKHSLREIYFDGDNIDRIRFEKNRLVQLMAHFIYVSRYKLPFMQKMRLRYKSNPKYKIGFCFALLAQLRREQKLIWQTLATDFKFYNHITIFMKFYERVLRLNQDIRDLVVFTLKLNYEMHKLYDPVYYIDSDEDVTALPNITAYNMSMFDMDMLKNMDIPT